MGIYRAYTRESRPEPARKATTSEYKTESDSLVGCKTEQLFDSINSTRLGGGTKPNITYHKFQGGVDLGSGQELVSVYHLIKVGDNCDRPEEVRVKVFLPRENPVVPSV